MGYLMRGDVAAGGGRAGYDFGVYSTAKRLTATFLL